jgi:hypothetical protein
MPSLLPRALLLAGIVLAAGACADHNPAGPPVGPPEDAPPVHAAVQCRMDVRAQTITCGPAAPETPPGVSPLIVGGQGTSVRLASSGTSYDASTGIFRSSVTVQNLMAFALGTEDGYFPSPEGVRVFFHSGPIVTQGTGAVSVANADGEGIFTTAGQTYFQYDGILAPGGTTAPREWRFNVPSTVDYFVFTVMVSAPIRGRAALPPRLFFLGGAGTADTVDAEPDSVLRVAVRGANGKPVANTSVQVSTVPLTDPSFAREVMVGPAGAGYVDYSASANTNAQGIAEFRVKMGPKAGPGRLVVRATSQFITDTARYTILPGKASQMRSLPEDTVVLVGARAPLRAAAFDRHGNTVADSIAFSVAGGPGTLAGSEVVAGASIGVVRAVATAGAASDTSYVRVVPPGTVAAHVSNGYYLYVFSLDGSDVRQVHTTILSNAAGYNGNMAVGWLTPTKLVYHDNNGDHTKQLYVLNLTTGQSARFLPQADWMESETYPRVSRDGSWVYFSGGTYSSLSMYRARADGTGKALLTFQPYPGIREWSVDPSPDGTRVVYVRENADNELVVGELSTGKALPLGLSGFSPRWSPDGTRIAYIAVTGQPALADADGTGERSLSATYVQGEIDWSPDGKYIIGSAGDNKVLIIEIATGNEVVVAYPELWGVMSPVWKP